MNLYNFTEVDSLDFARCQRPDGSFYGTGGVCRSGTSVGPKEMKALKSAAAKGNKKAKEAIAVVEGKKTQKEAQAALRKSPPPEMKKELAALGSTKAEEGDAKAMRKRFKESEKELGAGSYGSVKETAEGTVIKEGFIGKNEIAVQQKLAGIDGVPKVLDHAYTSEPFADRKGDRKGFVEMEKARGTSLASQQRKLDNPAVKGDNATKIQNEYLRLRAEVHRRGVAHGDMHEQNVTWDGKKMGVIDFGLSKIGYREALNEALGTFDRDMRAAFTLDGLSRDGANTARAGQLQRKIEQIRKKAGGAITEKRAQQLIEELYDGF